MSQHDYVIANGTGAATRSDLNNALAAIVSNNSGATEPVTMYAYQWWADTSTGLLKLRNAANNAWITLRELDGTLTIEAGTVSAPGLAFASDLNTGVFSAGADQLAIATNGVERVEWGTSEVVFNDGGTNYDFRIEGDTVDSLFFVDASTDRVGLGTSSPGQKLEVQGSAVLFGNGTSDVDVILGIAGYGTRLEYSTGKLFLRTNNNNRLTVDNSGNVGIGTTSPGGRLHVDNVSNSNPVIIKGASSEGSYIDFYNNAASSSKFRIGQGYASGSDNVAFLGNTANADLVIATNNTERCRVDSSGRLLVGTSTAVANARLESVTTTNSQLPFITYTNASGDLSTPGIRVYKYDNNSTTSQVFVQFAINATSNGCGQINANGTSQAAFGSYSDARLKENVVELGSQWNSFKSLRPVEFDYIELEGGGHQIGFIAQEMQEVFPDLVGERQDGMLTITGMGKNESRLIKALQEAMERIETLEAEVAALKGA